MSHSHFSSKEQTICAVTLPSSDVKTDNPPFVDVPHWIRIIKNKEIQLKVSRTSVWSVHK